MKNFKTFYKSQTAICLKEIIWDLQDYTDICFPSAPRIKLLGVYELCSAIFFWHQPEEICSWLCCSSIFVIMSSELRFVKSVRFFEQNCILKWVIFFASFCWLWDFLPENVKLIDKVQMWGFYSFNFWSKFCFWGDCFRAFRQCDF